MRWMNFKYSTLPDFLFFRLKFCNDVNLNGDVHIFPPGPYFPSSPHCNAICSDCTISNKWWHPLSPSSISPWASLDGGATGGSGSLRSSSEYCRYRYICRSSIHSEYKIKPCPHLSLLGLPPSPLFSPLLLAKWVRSLNLILSSCISSRGLAN